MSIFTNEDCMDLMSRYPDNHFDLAIVDPPYGIGRDGQKYSKHNKKNSRHGQHKYFEKKYWDNNIPSEHYFYELFRVSKNQIIWGANYFVNNLKSKSGWIFWDKMQRGFNSDGELAYSSFDISLKVVEIQRGVLASENTIHPTQKPIKLYKWLLTNYAKSGQLILDTHVGSASSLIACEDLGFDYVACELDKDYYRSACERIEQFRNQPKLFSPAATEGGSQLSFSDGM